MRALSEERKKKLKEMLLEGNEIGDIAKALDCDRKTVQRWKKLFIINDKQRPFLQKKENLIKDFDQGHYDELHRQFTDEEVVTYVEIYAVYREQFDDLFGTERTQIHFIIIQQLLINRLMRRLKKKEALLESTTNAIIAINKKMQKEKDEETILTQTTERHVLQSNLPEITTELDKVNKQVKEFEDNLRKGLEKLSATRKERLEKSTYIKSDWQELIKGLEDKENREIQGKLAERLRMAEEIESERLRQPIEFADESIDAVLLDDKTEFEG